MQNELIPNRRVFAKRAGLLLATGRQLLAQEPRRYSAEFPDMLVNYVANRVNQVTGRWDEERAKIKTGADVEARNRLVRSKAMELLQPFPERGDLAPKIVRVLDRDGYRIEVLMFQSRRDFWVPASLYIPTAGRGPFPGIISPCGHSSNGRIYAAYQSMYLSLVKSGFVVLAYDPIGQGERRQHWNPFTQKNDLPGPVTEEHFLAGQLLLLLGESLTTYRIWDGMRAIDYLLTRPEVDAERIGSAGQSGGGTFTLFISAVDERVSCASVNQGGTSHRWPVRFGPGSRLSTGDTEQHIFRSALYGIDLCDLHVAIAPRPLLATIEHYSTGFNRTAEHIRARYTQLGVPERFATEEAADPHGMTVKLRLRTTDWFCRWFYQRPGPETEPDFRLEEPEALYASPNGSLRYSHQGDTVFSLMLKKQAALPPDRSIPAGREKIRKLLRIPNSRAPLAPRSVVTTPRKGYRIDKLEFLSEPGIYIPAWVYLPGQPRAGERPILFVNDGGIHRDGMEFGVLESLARKGRTVIAVEVRGTGGTAPSQPGDAETTLQYLLWEMDESLLGMRVNDVLRSVDFVLERAGDAKDGLHVIGKGTGALWTLFAAALDPRIRSCVCDGLLLSYGHLASLDRYEFRAGVFVLDVLKHFDLPQVAAAIAGRDLAILSPVDGNKRPVDPALARKVYLPAADLFRKAGGRFQVVGPEPEVDPAEEYLALLRA
jgi:cephalosporin-C deacetylase-like acetyl esterase